MNIYKYFKILRKFIVCISKYVLLLLMEYFFGFQIGLEHMSRYVSPVNPAIYPHLTLVLLGIGIFFMAWFFVYPLIQYFFINEHILK